MLTNPTFTNAFFENSFGEIDYHLSPGSIVDVLHLAVLTPESLSVLDILKAHKANDGLMIAGMIAQLYDSYALIGFL